MKFSIPSFTACLVSILISAAPEMGNAGYYPPPSLPDIPTVAIQAGQFKTLVAALEAADLVKTLSAPNGPYTVFAPTDDAFAALPKELVTCLLKPSNKDVLTEILLYHVAKGAVYSKSLFDGMMIPTIQGEKVEVEISSSGVKINDSKVLKPDIKASNGVIHVIDAVLVPPSIDVGAFLRSCSAPPPPVRVMKCYYGGMSRKVGEWHTGPTKTCRCGSHGGWTECYPNKVRRSKMCYYHGKAVPAGQWYRGDKYACMCSSSGHWIKCH